MRINITSIIVFYLISSFTVVAKDNADLLVVGTENLLLQYQENGQFKGPTIEILNELLKQSQLSAEVKLMPWARAFNIAKKEKNTLVLSIIRTPAREELFHWIGKVSELSLVFISLKNKPENNVQNDQQAKNKKIAVIRDSKSHSELLVRGYLEGENLYVVSSLEKLFTLFIKGRVDLVYVDPSIIKEFQRRSNQESIELSFSSMEANDRWHSYIAASLKTDKNIVNRLKKAMAGFEKTDRYLKLLVN